MANTRLSTLRQLLVAGVVLLSVLNPVTALAAEPPSAFSLQVTPSPLVATVKPGVPGELELKIHNASTGTENLKIEPRSFTFNDASGQIALNDTTPPDVATWLSFGAPTFTIQPGEWFTQKVHISLPKDTGFSYSFALVISRQATPKPTAAGRLLKGSVAVFTLVNVDRPGATRKLEVSAFTASKHVYEYLPADLSVHFKNTGNSIVQPYGNIFIQRGSNDKSPIAVLPVNESHGYILPATNRTLTTSWNSGFPLYQTVATATGSQKHAMVWDWANVSQFRIGRYTAKLVAAYSDGNRDVPLTGEVSFWVFPWKIVLGLFILSLLVIVGLWSFIRKLLRISRRLKHTKYTGH